MDIKTKELDILISGGIKTIECYKGLNIVNNAFTIDELDLYFSKDIKIKINTLFIPGKILVFLGHHFYKLDTQGKNLIVEMGEVLQRFITECGLIEYITKKYISPYNLRGSVILPFSRISTQSDFISYIGVYGKNLEFTKNKDDIISYISELQYNSIEHGDTQDIYIMGQRYPSSKLIDITLYDAGDGMLKNDVSEIVSKVYYKYSTTDFYEYIEKKYGLNVFFIILCVCTQFSSKGPNQGGLGLLGLSEYLYKNNGVIQIATDNIYIDLKFKKICDKIDIGSVEIDIEYLDNNIEGTYISFTSSI